MPLASMSLGNMGGATTLCLQIPHHIEDFDLKLECPSGSLDPYAKSKSGEKIFQIGIVNADLTDSTACSIDALNDPYNCS